MSGAVHQPGHIQDEGIPEHGRHEPAVGPCLAPAIHRNQSRDQETDHRHQQHVISGVKSYKY